VSIVYLLEFNGKRLLFTGDIEPKVADRIAEELKPHLDGKRVNAFLMTHHGANSSSTEKLDQVIRPWWVVISAGNDNDYDHPHEKAVNRLKATRRCHHLVHPDQRHRHNPHQRAGDLSWTASGTLKAPGGRDTTASSLSSATRSDRSTSTPRAPNERIIRPFVGCLSARGTVRGGAWDGGSILAPWMEPDIAQTRPSSLRLHLTSVKVHRRCGGRFPSSTPAISGARLSFTNGCLASTGSTSSRLMASQAM
jgi:hypothetical protein